MIANFNGIFYLILNVLILLLFTMYVFRILFAPAGLAKEFNMDKSSIFIIRYLGCFALAALFIGVYILFRPNGPEGTWVYYNFLFLVALFTLIYDFAYYFKLIDRDIGAKNSKMDLGFSIFLTVASALLITGLSDKIYI